MSLGQRVMDRPFRAVGRLAWIPEVAGWLGLRARARRWSQGCRKSSPAQTIIEDEQCLRDRLVATQAMI